MCSQVDPDHPLVHVQTKPAFAVSVHVPPFLQGKLMHPKNRLIGNKLSSSNFCLFNYSLAN